MTGQENSDRETLVFVYGTLKQGEPNDHVMINPETGKQRFVGVARTLGKFPLIVASKYNVPFLLKQPGHGFVSACHSCVHQFPF